MKEVKKSEGARGGERDERRKNQETVARADGGAERAQTDKDAIFGDGHAFVEGKRAGLGAVGHAFEHWRDGLAEGEFKNSFFCP